jgi:elongation factor Tu
MLSNILRR